MRYVLLLTVTLFLTGCATGLGVTGMTPEQLAEFSKIKDSTISCTRGTYAGVSVTTIFVNVDSVKAAPSNITVKDDCSVVFSGKSAP